VPERGVSQFWPRAIALADEQASLPVRKTEENFGAETEERGAGGQGQGTAVVLISLFLFEFRQTRCQSGCGAE